MAPDGKDLRCVLAPNPSPLTGPGTNTFLLGRQNVAIIDPGPDLEPHRQAILAAAPGPITHIFVTHAHLDHSPGAAPLSRETGAPILAFGDALAGRSPAMQALAQSGLIGGGEGVDAAFAPDICLADNQIVETPEWRLRAIHTPGHFGNHLAFDWDGQVFCGDLILGWSSTLISPPDGDLADYFRSLQRLSALAPHRLLPAHGDPVDDPQSRIADLAAHRRERSAQIMTKLRKGPATAADLAGTIYDVPPALLPAAQRNVLAHLVALAALGAIRHQGELTLGSEFTAW